MNLGWSHFRSPMIGMLKLLLQLCICFFFCSFILFYFMSLGVESFVLRYRLAVRFLTFKDSFMINAWRETFKVASGVQGAEVLSFTFAAFPVFFCPPPKCFQKGFTLLSLFPHPTCLKLSQLLQHHWKSNKCCLLTAAENKRSKSMWEDSWVGLSPVCFFSVWLL